MSDKPIHAEIVRADQVKVGDSFMGFQCVYKIKRIDVIHGCGTREFVTGNGTKYVIFDDDLIVRILPEPVEVREFWRATANAADDAGDQTYGGLSWEADTEDEANGIAERMLKRRGIETADIEEVTEIIKSRKVVKP